VKLTSETAEAIIRLHASSDFKVFMHALGDFGEKLVEQMIYADKDQLPMLQGKTQAVTEILKALATAPKKFK
jgi:hypothetical protein